MKYEINNTRLAATLTEVNMEASVVGQAPLEVAVGGCAHIDVGAVANYIKSGTAEIEALVETAEEYKTQAENSATLAVTSATAAANAQNAAVEANTAAQTAKTDAESACQTANSQRQLAEQYATAAGQSAVAAAASASATANMADKDLSNLTATGEAKFTAKQDVISDLSTIRSGAALGATAVQPASLAAVATTGEYSDLSGTPDLSVYALDNAVVHLAGAETIGGTKTFSGDVKLTKHTGSPQSGLFISNDYPNYAISIQSTECTKGTAPDNSKYAGIDFYGTKADNYRDRLGLLEFEYHTDKTTSVKIGAYKANSSSDDTVGYINIYYPPSSNPYAELPETRPNGDNNCNLGIASKRWKQLYAGTTTISTSDERTKQGIEEIPDEVLDAWGEVKFYRYKFNDAVEEKGFENARYHTGMVAQRIEQVFAAHGLNAFEYGLLCYDEWEAQEAEYDKDGNEIIPAVAAGNRYSLRYEECLTMEAAYQRRRADRIEARLAALEARA